jgi:flagellar biosynthesis protein FlhF
MRIRVFTAPRMAEAMAMVRSELGADAVILGNRRTAAGVEVTAALEAPEPPAVAPASAAPAPSPSLSPAAKPSGAMGVLARHGVPPQLAARWDAGPAAALPAPLAQRLAFGLLPDGVRRPLLLAGPCGAGKSLPCAKLAARAVLRGGGAAPLVVTADGQRAGATEQLAAFARVLDAPLAQASDPASMAAAVLRRREGQPVLIDTAGCDPFDPEQAASLLALARAAGADIVAVLPAGLDTQESADLARAFAVLGARYLLPTRLDAARRLGGVLSAAATGLALTEAGTGPGVADGLTALSPDWLARRLERGWSAPQEASS